RHLVERVVGGQRQHPVLRALRAGLGGDELHVRAGQPAEHLVRSYRVESGDDVEDRDRDLHTPDATRGAPRSDERRPVAASRFPPSTDRSGGVLPPQPFEGIGRVYAATRSTKLSSRCLCDGQYLLPGSGTRWQGVPLRVEAWQHSGVPSMLSPSCSRWATYPDATLM